MIEPRRVKLLRVYPAFVFAVLKENQVKDNVFRAHLFKGMPSDAQLVNYGFNDGEGVFYLTIESETFDLVPGGELIPLMDLQVATHLVTVGEGGN